MSVQDDVGCWAKVTGPLAPGAAALFLDRDGVIVEEVNYLRRIEDVRLIPGAAATIRAANQAGVPVVVVTNQSGVARGRFGWREFEGVQDRMLELLAAEGAGVDAVFACGCHESGSGALGVADHPWRKPNPGMLREAAGRLGLDLGRSMIVGDKAADLAAGRAAGLPRGVHVATGHGDASEQAEARALAAPGFEPTLAPSIAAVEPLVAGLASPG